MTDRNHHGPARSEDSDQKLYWSLFGGLPGDWSTGMVAMVRDMESRLPPAFLRTYIASGSSHGMHRSDDLWTMEHQGPSG